VREQSADDPLVGELQELWRRLLNADVTPATSFFKAGGHSLLAAKLAQDVEELTGVHLELQEIFIHPTPAALAARLKAGAAGHE
jgi:acyl carrier protein